MSFNEFTTSNLEPEELAEIFMLNYERPSDKSEETINSRVEQARKWFEYFND